MSLEDWTRQVWTLTELLHQQPGPSRVVPLRSPVSQTVHEDNRLLLSLWYQRVLGVRDHQTGPDLSSTTPLLLTKCFYRQNRRRWKEEKVTKAAETLSLNLFSSSCVNLWKHDFCKVQSCKHQQPVWSQVFGIWCCSDSHRTHSVLGFSLFTQFT